MFAGLSILAGGCATKYKRPPRPLAGTTLPTSRPTHEFGKFIAEIDPPPGWRYELTSESDRHEHVTWISPSGHTACGILYFKLPFPVGHEMAFRHGFLAEMKHAEGVANVLEKRWDPEIEALRFVVESRLYHVRANFFVRGWEGWMFYAGRKLGQPIDEQEMSLAEQVKESAEFVESK